MMGRTRGWVLALAAFGAFVPLLPLAGLAMGVFEPPRPGFGARGDWRAETDAAPLFVRTVLLAAGTSIAAGGLGAWTAWVGARAALPFGRALQLFALLPLAIPSYVLAATLRQTLGPGGFVGGPLGLGSFTGLLPAGVVLTLATAPYFQLLIGAALSKVPAAEEEAARSLGASPLSTFLVATWPRLRTAVAAGLLLSQLYVVGDFGAVATLDAPVLSWRLYQAVQTQRFEAALVLGLVLLGLTVGLLGLARWVQGEDGAVRGAANPRPPAPRRLGLLARVFAYAVPLTVGGLGAALPLATLGGWVLSAERLASVGGPLGATLAVAVPGTILTVLVAAFPAWVAARSRPFGPWVQRSVYLTGALPAVLLAFGLLLFALAVGRSVPGAYGALGSTGALLMLGYAARFGAEAFAGLHSAALALDQRQEETAATLGAGAARRFWLVIGPNLSPGVAAATLLVLLSIMKELPVTLLLGGPTGLRTLAFRMFDRYEDAFLGDAGLAGLLLVGVAAAALGSGLAARR